MSKEEARKCRLHLLNRDKEKTSIFFLKFHSRISEVLMTVRNSKGFDEKMENPNGRGV